MPGPQTQKQREGGSKFQGPGYHKKNHNRRAKSPYTWKVVLNQVNTQFWSTYNLTSIRLVLYIYLHIAFPLSDRTKSFLLIALRMRMWQLWCGNQPREKEEQQPSVTAFREGKMHSEHPSGGSTCGTTQRRSCSRQVPELEDTTTALLQREPGDPSPQQHPLTPISQQKKKNLYSHWPQYN